MGLVTDIGTKLEMGIKQGLSKQEALALTRLASRNETIIEIDDLQNSVDVSYEAAKKMANDLVKKQWLEPLKRGTYLIVPLAAGETGEYTEHEFVIASHLADPMYVSYWSALNYYGLTEQVPTTVFAATTERIPEQEIHGVVYRFITLKESKFFGFSPSPIDNHRRNVNIASIEKTLVDCADHPEHCGGITELAKALGNAAEADIEFDTVVDHLERVGNGAAIKRIVYLSHVLGIELPRSNELEREFTEGYSKLDPTRSDEGKHSKQYRLLLNVPEKEIHAAGEPR